MHEAPSRPDPGPTRLALRTASGPDVPGLEALIESAYRGDESRAGWTTEADLVVGRRLAPGALARVVDAPEGCMLVAEDRGSVVGCCQVERRGDGTAYFGMLAVRPRAQGGGTGRALVGAAERTARERWSASRMTLQVISVRTELIDWYRRLGYRLTGATRPFPYDIASDRPTRPDLEFAVLAKSLRPGTGRAPSPEEPAADGR